MHRRGERLEDAHGGRQVGCDPPMGGRQQHPEATGTHEVVEQIGRHAAGRLDLGGPASDGGFQVPHGIENLRVAGRAHGGGGGHVELLSSSVRLVSAEHSAIGNLSACPLESQVHPI